MLCKWLFRQSFSFAHSFITAVVSGYCVYHLLLKFAQKSLPRFSSPQSLPRFSSPQALPQTLQEFFRLELATLESWKKKVFLNMCRMPACSLPHIYLLRRRLSLFKDLGRIFQSVSRSWKKSLLTRVLLSFIPHPQKFPLSHCLASSAWVSQSWK